MHHPASLLFLFAVHAGRLAAGLTPDRKKTCFNKNKSRQPHVPPQNQKPPPLQSTGLHRWGGGKKNRRASGSACCPRGTRRWSARPQRPEGGTRTDPLSGGLRLQRLHAPARRPQPAGERWIPAAVLLRQVKEGCVELSLA